MTKKIFIVGGLTSGFGGMETVFKKLHALLSEDNAFDITFYLSGNPAEKNNFDWLDGIHYKHLKSKLHFRALERLSGRYQFKKAINKEKPHAIIAYDSLGCSLAKDAVSLSSSPCPVISWMHISFDILNNKNKTRITKADYHFAICDEIKEQLVKFGIDAAKIHTIYNPTTRTDVIIPRPEKGTQFLYIGRVQYAAQKNVQELFHALAQLDCDYTLDMVGGSTDADSKQLKALAEKLNIADKIIWHGWQVNAWKYIEEQIKTTSAVVMSSNYEGFPMILGEAMAHGIYCISSDCNTGPRDIINKNNGLLYPVGDINKLTACLKQVCENNQLPSHQTIRETIHHLYDDIYIDNVKKLLQNK